MSGLDRLAKAEVVAEAALDRKALDLVALDAREITSFADTFILASGTSSRHLRAIADAIEEALRLHGDRPLGVEGYDEGRWILMDLGDLIVHLFMEEVRQHYDLERLWSDAPTLELGASSAQEASR